MSPTGLMPKCVRRLGVGFGFMGRAGKVSHELEDALTFITCLLKEKLGSTST